MGQNNLASLYMRGEGVPQDYVQASCWLSKAVDQGYATAQANLAVLYRYGFGVQKDIDKAIKLYRLAADQGNAVAQESLEELLYNNE